MLPFHNENVGHTSVSWMLYSAQVSPESILVCTKVYITIIGLLFVVIHAFPHISLSQKQKSKMAKAILSLKQLKYGAEMDETDHPVLPFALIK